jgi:hypothetical protein
MRWYVRAFAEYFLQWRTQIVQATRPKAFGQQAELQTNQVESVRSILLHYTDFVKFLVLICLYSCCLVCHGGRDLQRR